MKIALFGFIFSSSLLILNHFGYINVDPQEEEVVTEDVEPDVNGDLFTLSCKGEEDEKIEIPYKESADLSVLSEEEKEIYVLMFDIVRKQEAIKLLNDEITKRAKNTCENKGYSF